jgi:GcrA cell cycle regulator
MEWTEQRIEMLRKLWGQGQTASQIATLLGGVTRNAVIGKAHRLGLTGRPSPIKREGTEAAAPRRKPAAQRRQQPAVAAMPAPRHVAPQSSVISARPPKLSRATARPHPSSMTAAPSRRWQHPRHRASPRRPGRNPAPGRWAIPSSRASISAAMPRKRAGPIAHIIAASPITANPKPRKPNSYFGGGLGAVGEIRLPLSADG